MRNGNWLLWLVFTFGCLLNGCQKPSGDVAVVEGRILFLGLPARASVSAQRIDKNGRPDGRVSTAETRADGTFELAYSEQQNGALIGTHRVQVTVFPIERAEGELDFQARFRPVKVARFTREVESQTTNEWNFYLNY